MNAIELLQADHKTVERLFAQVEESDKKEHVAIFKKIKQELEVHAHIEETVFYPSLQADGDEELVELTAEAIQEHMQMKTFLGQLSVVGFRQRKIRAASHQIDRGRSPPRRGGRRRDVPDGGRAV